MAGTEEDARAPCRADLHRIHISAAVTTVIHELSLLLSSLAARQRAQPRLILAYPQPR